MTEIFPALPVVDIAVAVTFYTERMGFTEAYHNNGFAKLRRDAVELHLWAASDTTWNARLDALKAGTLHVPPDKEECVIVSGAETFLAGTASCRIQVEGVDELYAEYKTSGVLYNDRTVIETTDWGTREFPTLDLHGNLLTFFERTTKP